MLSVVNILINVGILTLESLAIFPYLNHGGKCKNMLFFQFFKIMVLILNWFLTRYDPVFLQGEK